MYTTLRNQLIDRVNDKEPIIRAHAVIALSKLVGSEDPSELPNDEPTILITVLEVLCGDPSPEVRRAALLNIPLTAETLEVILSRTRDTDPLTRKLVYSTVLQTRLTHPRQLSIAQREQVVKHGLGDREPGTRLAAGKLVASWLDAVMVEGAEERDEDSWTGDDGGVMRGFVAFLRIFDVVGPGEEVAVDAVQSIFVTRPEYLDIFTFSGEPVPPMALALGLKGVAASVILERPHSRISRPCACVHRTLPENQRRGPVRECQRPCGHRVRVLRARSV